MKSFLYPYLPWHFSLGAFAQSNDPVLMHINGKPVTLVSLSIPIQEQQHRRCCGAQNVDEYVEMFVNYKLKVEAAEAMRMDTLFQVSSANLLNIATFS